jgi:hypothetical protein
LSRLVYFRLAVLIQSKAQIFIFVVNLDPLQDRSTTTKIAALPKDLGEAVVNPAMGDRRDVGRRDGDWDAFLSGPDDHSLAVARFGSRLQRNKSATFAGDAVASLRVEDLIARDPVSLAVAKS